MKDILSKELWLVFVKIVEMHLGWFKHLKDPSEQERFQNSIYGAKEVLNRIKTIIEEEERDLYQTERDSRSFDTPNWAYKQAYKNGFLSALNIIKKLVDLDQQRPPQEPKWPF